MLSKATTVAEYFASLPEDRRTALEASPRRSGACPPRHTSNSAKR